MLEKIKRKLFPELYKKIELLEMEKSLLTTEFEKFKKKSQATVNKVNSYYLGKIKSMSRA